MSSELRDTGERNPIYKSLRGCVILLNSLYWNVLQNRCRRRMMVLEIELQHAESFHTLVLIQILEFMPQSQNEPQVHIIQFLGSHGSEIQVSSTTTPDRNCWVVICRGKIASWTSYISEIPDRIPRVMSYFWTDQLQKKVKHVLQSWSNPASRKVMRRSLKF